MTRGQASICRHSFWLPVRQCRMTASGGRDAQAQRAGRSRLLVMEPGGREGITSATCQVCSRDPAHQFTRRRYVVTGGSDIISLAVGRTAGQLIGARRDVLQRIAGALDAELWRCERRKLGGIHVVTMKLIEPKTGERSRAGPARRRGRSPQLPEALRRALTKGLGGHRRPDLSRPSVTATMSA